MDQFFVLITNNIMEKLDLAKKYKAYYTAKSTPEFIELEEVNYLAIKGVGDPSQQEFANKVQALYAVAYSVKFVFKMRKKDFVVPKLEGLWWFDEEKYDGVSISEAPKIIHREEWQYRLLIRLPDFAEETDVTNAREEVCQKKKLTMASSVEFFKMREGKSIQILHVGSFEKEPETLRQLEAFIQSKNLKKNGLHHEIYLSDFRKTPSEKLKTILREPVY
jgi:hypothetical protein